MSLIFYALFRTERNTMKVCVKKSVIYEVHTCTLTPTQDSDVCVGFLRRICVELAHIASLIGE